MDIIKFVVERCLEICLMRVIDDLLLAGAPPLQVSMHAGYEPTLSG